MNLQVEHKRAKIIIFVIFISTFLFNFLGGKFPVKLEFIYSNGFNKYIRIILSRITGILPFSVAEFFTLFSICLLIYLVIKLILSIFTKRVLNELTNIIIFAISVYVLFILLWGGNYNRLSFENFEDLTLRKYSTNELKSLCKALIKETNELRLHVSEDQDGIMKVDGGYKEVIARSNVGYKNLSKNIKELDGNYGHAKPLLISYPMMYTGITGIFFPFTAEANFNTMVEDSALPHTILHEMAHQRGFAPEDEANYIAYLSCMAHTDYDFKYSGAITALIYSMNALYNSDYDSYIELKSSYSEGVLRDLKYAREYWSEFEGKIETVATTVNNTYLKTNGQSDGVKSYGKMVDLLLAHYLKTGNVY